MNNCLTLVSFVLLMTGCANSTMKRPVNEPIISKHVASSQSLSQNLPLSWQTNGERTFIYFPKKTKWAVYDEHGKMVRVGRGSGGKLWCEDLKESCKTVSGTFQIYSKKGPECTSNKYPLETEGGALMPYCQHFYQGYALHGSDFVPDYNASHGCIRVRQNQARWLHEYLEIGSQVIVMAY
jgi:lipoprotein-anchoring transpeptidase ErfK/SrfK